MNWNTIGDALLPYLRAFLIGGGLCVIAQILIDKTKMTPARILVLYVVAGVILGGVGIYAGLADFGGAGATVPLTGFGYLIAKGVREAVEEKGLLGAFLVLSGRYIKFTVCMLQSCPTLCHPVDCSPPGSSVHGTLMQEY